MLRESERCRADNVIVSKSARRFPEHFRGTETAKLSKASRWYKDREEILSVSDDEAMRVSHRANRKPGADRNATVAQKNMIFKAGKGRGRKIAP